MDYNVLRTTHLLLLQYHGTRQLRFCLMQSGCYLPVQLGYVVIEYTVQQRGVFATKLLQLVQVLRGDCLVDVTVHTLPQAVHKLILIGNLFAVQSLVQGIQVVWRE